MSRVAKSSFGGVTSAEIENLLKDFKTNLLGTISSQLDALKIKKKQDESVVLLFFCSKCIKKIL